jgi:hypothetical protein
MPDGISAPTISTRFGLIFWGLLLVIIDLSVFDIDVLPDFIG